MISHAHKTRISIIFFCIAFLFLLILLHLFFIQILNGSYYQSLALRQHQTEITLHPPRASIFDRQGIPLAYNTSTLSAFIFPKKVRNSEKLLNFLKNNFAAAYEKIQQNSSSNFMFIKRRLTKEEESLCKEAHIEDIHFLQEMARYYPHPSTSTIVGITDIDNKGAAGLEYLYNDSLAGKATTYLLERDARSGCYYVTRSTKIPGHDGESLHLTIDNSLQFLVEQEVNKTLSAFNATEGMAIIMDPTNGYIHALVSLPRNELYENASFNPEYSSHHAVTQAYEFGSVFKAFTALAALENQTVEIDEIIDCKNTRTAFLDGRQVNTWRAEGQLSFKDVIALSNNIGIAIVAKRLGIKLYDCYTKLGFSKKTSVQLPGQTAGFINPPDKWSKQSIISLSYGYEVSASLVQIAQAFGIIANDGKSVHPTLLKTAHSEKSEQIFSKKATQEVKEILEYTTQAGTTRRAAIDGYCIMTKTGTANILERGIYNPHKNLYTCAGIIERNEYKRVVITTIKEAQKPNLYASTVAVPLFEQIVQRMLVHEKIV